MAEVVDDALRLFRLLEEQEERIQRIFLTAIENMRDELNIAELADLLQEGRAADAIGRLQYIADQLGSASGMAFIAAGQSAAEFLDSAGLGRVVFDQVNINAVAAMQRNRLDLVREFTREQARATWAALTEGVESGTNPIAQARNFRDSIGLTKRQWGAVNNHREDLMRAHTDPDAASRALQRKNRDRRYDRTIRAARRGNKAIASDKLDRMVDRYTEISFRKRSETIARTEALRAVHQGNEEAYRQAIESEVFKPEQLERTWRTSVDGRERDTHRKLNGTTAKWGEAWTTENGSLRYPGDPLAPPEETIRCRCAILTRIK